jgi:ribosomal protein L11 methyltransferase
VPAGHAETVLAELVELAPAGFEQVDGDGYVEYALYGAPGELPGLAQGRAEIAGVAVEVSGCEVGDDWASRWREFHRPAQIGRIRVRAPWHNASNDGREGEAIDIVIDPGQAFGTGAHPTTRLCLELLQGVAPDGPLADLGCGSGVLAIAAAKLGFVPVAAFDHESAAVTATLDNARDNGVTLDRVERLDLRVEPAPVEGVTVANLVRPLLLRVAELLPEQPETLIVSGLLEGEEDEVAAAFAHLRERRRHRLQGWSALLLTRP